uniref:Uncharacterized protein n=1 Tax=Oryza brachyantha TaxID=4533 RepID=J3MS09_ORYBR
PPPVPHRARSGSHPSPRGRAAAPRRVARTTLPHSSTRWRRRLPPCNRAGLLRIPRLRLRPTATGRSRWTTHRSQWSASYSCSTTNPIQSSQPVINHSSAN